MATTVGSHSVSAFATPVNGGPLDANVVRGNDNTIRTAYVAHDADTGIHVQSSSLASRPTAGTAGRKWITVDTGSYKLWYDDGTTWHEVGTATIDVFVIADENLVKGDVVKVTGYNNGAGAPRVAKVSSASDVAFGIINQTIANGATGYLTNTGIIADVATNAFAVGDILYPNTSGGLTTTKPTSGNYQIVAYVLRSNANNGVLYVEFSGPRIVERSDNTASTVVLRDASGNFAAGTITAALTGNASTATTLQTARTLWGQSFNGSANVTGALTSVSDITMTGTLSGASTVSATTLTGTLSTAAQPNVTSVGTLSSLTVSGDLTVDTSTLKVDSANNRVGIGTASPSYNLVVNGASPVLNLNGTGTTGTTLFSTISGGSNGVTAIQSYNGGILAFDTGATGAGQAERMRIDASGNLAVDTNTLYVDAANNRVGIGTASPGYPAQVYNGQATGYGLAVGNGTSGTSGDFAGLLMHTSGSVSAPLYNGAIRMQTTASAPNFQNPAMVFLVQNSGTSGLADLTERMRLDASGNLGVGTASPTAKLHVYGATTTTLRVDNGDNASAQTLALATGGTDRATISIASSSADLVIKSESTGGRNAGIQFWTGSTSAERMRLDASGNLGLGVTPSYKLDVQTSTNRLIVFGDTGTAVTSAVTSGGSSSGLRLNGFPLTFGGNGASSAEHARITSGGYFKASSNGVYFGSTSAYHELRKAEDNADWTAVVEHAGATAANQYGIRVGLTGDPNGTGNEFLYCVGNLTLRASIRSNGGIANYSANNVALSDARIKTDIAPVASMWDKVAALEIVTYKYNDQTHDDVNVGVIAQQVETVEPVWVDTDGFGETPEGEEPLKTVYTTDITFAAIKALQEAMARIEALEVEVAALKAGA